MARLVIFDADGTLRRTRVAGQPCPRADDEWELLPGVGPRVRELARDDGVWVGVASNQDQVAYGLLSEATAHALLARMIEAAAGVRPPAAAIRLCPHALDASCACRKPAPGMLTDIMRHYAVTARETLFVGNHDVDREAARRAGVRFAWAHDFFGWGEEQP